MGKGQYVLLDDGKSAPPRRDASSSTEMLSYSADPASYCGGLLFAVYYRHEKSSLFSSSGCPEAQLPDCAFHGAAETDIISFAGSLGLEICWLEQTWAAAVNSLKGTGLILLLGVGGFICYRLYNNHRELITDKFRRALRRIQQRQQPYDNQEYFEDDYFEPDFNDDIGLNCINCSRRKRHKLRKGSYSAHQIRTRWRHNASQYAHKATQTQSRSPEPVAKPPEFIPETPEKISNPIRRICSTPEGLVLQGRQTEDTGSQMLAVVEEKDNSSCDNSRAPSVESYRIRSYSLSVKDDRSQAEAAPWIRYRFYREGSIESIASGTELSEMSRLIRECSLDSNGSEFSLDISFHDRCGLKTLHVLERLEAEVSHVKSNCLAMNQEISSLHDVNLPRSASQQSISSMSGVETLNIHLNRASFKGLLSLTALADEMSDSASTTSESPMHRPGSRTARIRRSSSSSYHIGEEDPNSLEWDNDGLFISTLDEVSEMEQNSPSRSRSGSPVTVRSAEIELKERPSPPLPVTSEASSLLQVKSQNTNQWCSQESGYQEWESSSQSALLPLPENREKEMESMSCTPSDSVLNSPQSDSAVLLESPETVRRRQWAETKKSNRDSAIFDVDTETRSDAISPRIRVGDYADSTWQGNTSRAAAIKEAYAQVERLTGCSAMRRMRNDNYSVLRAALYQMVAGQYTVPSAAEAMQAIEQGLRRGFTWIHHWSFAHRLPYNNAMDGFKDCLSSLDNLLDEVKTADNPAEALIVALNADAALETRVMEALKLHLLGSALNLDLADSLGDALPLFAMTMFAQPKAGTALNWTSNYLEPVGDTMPLKQAELYLLGYCLGVRIDVYRPTSVQTDSEDNVDLVTSYPDWDSFSNRIDIIEEDESHYAVPVP